MKIKRDLYVAEAFEITRDNHLQRRIGQFDLTRHIEGKRHSDKQRIKYLMIMSTWLAQRGLGDTLNYKFLNELQRIANFREP